MAVLHRALEREKKKRKQAEQLLEDKSRELFLSYEELKKTHYDLHNTHKELKQKQQQLVQSEKMASLGVLSAGVAHEINNPISFILSNINTLSKYIPVFKNVYLRLVNIIDLKDNPENLSTVIDSSSEYLFDEEVEYLLDDTENLIQETIEGIDRVKEIVFGLKDFVREDQGEKISANINKSLQSTLKLLNNQIKYHCNLVEDYNDLPEILCYANKLNQVFMNLIVNASQAINEQGTIKIQTKKENDHIFISISDTGSGIKEKDLENLFTPFFTTKPVGQGTGLGLSISHGIIEEHGGVIEVESELDKGSKFTIKLPITT